MSDLPLTKLNITQLKSGYEHILNNSERFYESKFFEQSYASYYLITNKCDESKRLLFYPVTINELEEPSALDLVALLMVIRDQKLIERENINQMIIPIGEKGSVAHFTHKHMITLVIDIIGKTNCTEQPKRRYKINVKIIDSLSRSLPFCHQTESIHNIVKIFFFIIKFEREYINHQSFLDSESCCYFTLKTVDLVLSLPVQTFRDNKINMLIPKPNSWIWTCSNWLTENERMLIKMRILDVLKRSRLESTDQNTNIIEIE